MKYNKLSSKDLSLGYVQEINTKKLRTRLWREHTVYHIRSHAFGYGRVLWETARTYITAQKLFKEHINMFHKNYIDR
jgi:hypothetical protein